MLVLLSLMMGCYLIPVADVDPIVFLTPSADPGVPPLEAGQMRRCVINGTSVFDLEASPVC